MASALTYTPSVLEFKAKLAELSRSELLEIIRHQDPKFIKQINRIEFVFKNKLSHLTWDDGTPIDGRHLTEEELISLIDPPFMYSKDMAQLGFNEEQQRQIHISADPVLWAKHYLGVTPRVYQTLVLRNPNARRVMRFGRRMGKTFSLAILMLWYAYTNPGAKILVVAPMKSQVGLIFDAVIELAEKNELIKNSIIRAVTSPQYEINMANKSTVRFFTTGMKSNGKADVARGQEADVIVLDEMDYMGPDDLIALLAMLQQTNEEKRVQKMLVGASTPTGQRNIFWKWCSDPAFGFSSFWFPAMCFKPETLITMADGSFKEIKDIEIDDFVLTENGPQKVLKTFENMYNGKMNKVTTYTNSIGIEATPDHPFSVASRQRRQKSFDWHFKAIEDIQTNERRNTNSGDLLRYIFDDTINHFEIDLLDISDDLYECEPGRVKLSRPYIAGIGQDFKNSFPRFVGSDDVALAELIGWYLAEGHVESYIRDNPSTIGWTLNSETEQHVVDRIQNILNKYEAGTLSITKRKNNKATTIRVTNAPLAILCEYLCGKLSHQKQLHNVVMQAPHSFQESLITAYIEGDGCNTKNNSYSISTVSRILAKQIQSVTARLGKLSSITVSYPRERQINPDYPAYNTRPIYIIHWSPNTSASIGSAKTADAEYACLTKSNSIKEYNGLVYNFEVANTNSYIADGFLVHNCNPGWDTEIEAQMHIDYPTELSYCHEIEAGWGEPSDGVYAQKYVKQAFIDFRTPQEQELQAKPWKYQLGKKSARSFYVFGVDWDKYGAGVNIVVLEVCDQNYEDERFQGKVKLAYREEYSKEEFTYTGSVDRLIELAAIYQPRHIYVDRGSGETQIELLHKYGMEHPETRLKVIVKGYQFAESIDVKDPFTKQPSRKELKPFMVSNLSQFLERGQILFSETDEDLFRQFLGYIVVRTSVISGRPVFGMSGNEPDHAHDALLLACFAITDNYDELMNPVYATTAFSISNEVFLPTFNVETPGEAQVAEDKWGSNGPVTKKRAMAYNVRGRRGTIKRKMF